MPAHARGGRVILQNDFRAFGRELDRALVTSLAKVGREVAADVKSAQSKYNNGSILATAESTPATRTMRGFAVGVRSDDFRYIFFEKGTYQGRRGKLKRTRKGSSTHKGVVAGRFMFRALKARRERLNEYVAAQLL